MKPKTISPKKRDKFDRIEECLLDLADTLEQIESKKSKRDSIYQKIVRNLYEL